MVKRMLIIADMCALGQCSLSVALPVISACGAEACPLPTTLLSTHTVGFSGYSRTSLADAAQAVIDSLYAEDIRFDGALYMYLGGAKEARLAHGVGDLLKDGALRVVDPAMGDFGALYPDLDGETVAEVASLCHGADAITPNLTEACLLAREDVPESYDEAYISRLAASLGDSLGAKRVAITGVSLRKGELGAYAYDGKEGRWFYHPSQDRVCHGAGDLFSSALAGALARGEEFFAAVDRAEKFTYSSILATLNDPNHFYGLHFEQCLAALMREDKK